MDSRPVDSGLVEAVAVAPVAMAGHLGQDAAAAARDDAHEATNGPGELHVGVACDHQV